MQEEKEIERNPAPEPCEPAEKFPQDVPCSEPAEKWIDHGDRGEAGVLVAPEPWPNPWDKGGGSNDSTDGE